MECDACYCFCDPLIELLLLQEREYELSEEFNMSHENILKAEVLTMSAVNKYSYQVIALWPITLNSGCKVKLPMTQRPNSK